jgi:hypothetical protein
MALRPPVPVKPVPPPGPVLSLVDSAPFGDTGADDEWTGGFSYQPENRGSGELRDVCDSTSMDVPSIGAPGGLVAVPAITGGTLTNAASPYQYQITAQDANGTTLPCTAVPATIASGTTGSIALTWNTVEFATSYSVYGRKSGSMGLLASGITAAYDEDNESNTVTWTDTGAASVGAAAPSTDTSGGVGQYTNLPIVTFYPYIVQAEDECSTWGFEAHDYKGRATRLVNHAARWQIEREFWTGLLAQANGYPNNYLANASDPAYVLLTPGAGPPSVARGQQILEDYLQQMGFGGQGMIHVQAQTAPNLLSARLVDGPRPGTQQLLSVLGNIIIPGAGYTGNGPANVAPSTGCAYMFATDIVTIRMDDDDATEVYPDTFAEALDRHTNLITFRAKKVAAASWDAAIHACIQVTLAT